MKTGDRHFHSFQLSTLSISALPTLSALPASAFRFIFQISAFCFLLSKFQFYPLLPFCVLCAFLRLKLFDPENHEGHETPRNQRRRLKISAPLHLPNFSFPLSQFQLSAFPISAFRFPNFSFPPSPPSYSQLAKISPFIILKR